MGSRIDNVEFDSRQPPKDYLNMSMYIQYNQSSKYHYDFVDEAGKVTELRSKTTDNFLKVPDEYVPIINRKYISIAMIEKNLKNGQFEVLPSDKVRTTTQSVVVKSTLEDDLKYLTEDEQATFKALMTKIQKAKEIEVAKARFEAAMAEYERLKKEAQA